MTVDAVAAANGTPPRRTALVTRSASPKRRGKTWLPASETWREARACPKDNPGSTRVQIAARTTKAEA
jgi:hypothetical protein